MAIIQFPQGGVADDKPAHPECVTGEEREALDTLLAELHDRYLPVLLREDRDFVFYLIARRHLHWLRVWADRLNAVDASLPVCLARGKEQE